jgi:YgiT-type zinc finger domain-containing protein
MTFRACLFYKYRKTRMKCVICQYGETEPGTTTIAFTRDDTTVVIRDVPALIRTTCGEEYVDSETGRRLSQIAETAVNEGVQVDVRRYQAA